MTGLRFITFYPLQKNRAFNDGYGLSLAYHHLDAVDFALDYSELLLHFSFCTITLKGGRLRDLFDLIRSHEASRIVQVETIGPSADPMIFQVTAMARMFS
jgi:hypothetical protein